MDFTAVNHEELIRKITSEVLKQLNGAAGKKRVVILESCQESEKNPDVEIFIKQLGHNTEILYFDEELQMKPDDRLILPRLSCSRMADLALGRASDNLTKKLLGYLLAGKTMEILKFEYRTYLDTAPEELFRLYQGYEEKLAAFGLRLVTSEPKEAVRLTKNLISEKDILEAVKHGTAVVRTSAKATITPLALDCSKTHNVEILKG